MSPQFRLLALTAVAWFLCVLKAQAAPEEKKLAELSEPPPIQLLAWSANGQWLAAGSGDERTTGAVAVWNMGTRRLTWSLKRKIGASALALSGDGKYLAIGLARERWHMFDAGSGRELHQLAARGPCVFAQDHRTLLMADIGMFIKHWDVATGKQVTAWQEHGHPSAFALSRDGSILAVLAHDRDAFVNLWDMKHGKPIQKIERCSQHSRSIAFSPGGRWLVLGGRIHDIDTGKTIAAFGGPRPEQMSLSPDGNWLALVDGRTRFISVHRIDLRSATAAEKNSIARHIVSLDHEAAVVRDEATAELIMFGRRAEEQLVEAYKTTTSAEVKFRIRQVRDAIHAPKPAYSLAGVSEGRVEAIAFSPDGKLLASAGWDGVIVLWDTSTWRKLEELRRD